MAQIYVAGPCEIHVGTTSGTSLSFLGWSESGVRISENPEWDDVPADIAGTRVPADVQFMSEQAFVSLDLKMWNMNIFNQITARWIPSSGTPGFMPFGSIGKLMVSEGASYRLLVYPPYVTKSAMSSVRPYNFLAAWLAGPDDINPYGTKAMKIRMIFRSIPCYDPATGSWTLYNTDATGKPSTF